jgi:hypothetical protein
MDDAKGFMPALPFRNLDGIYLYFHWTDIHPTCVFRYHGSGLSSLLPEIIEAVRQIICSSDALLRYERFFIFQDFADKKNQRQFYEFECPKSYHE